MGDDLSVLRVIENGLKVTLPAPLPLDYEPPVACSSSASLSCFVAGLVSRSFFMCGLLFVGFRSGAKFVATGSIAGSTQLFLVEPG
jgi:hypothetical protein